MNLSYSLIHTFTVTFKDGTISYEEFKFAFVGTNMLEV